MSRVDQFNLCILILRTVLTLQGRIDLVRILLALGRTGLSHPSSLIFFIIFRDSRSSRRSDLHSLRLRLRSLQSSPVPFSLFVDSERKKKESMSHIPVPPVASTFGGSDLGACFAISHPSSSNKGCNRILRKIASMKHLRLAVETEGLSQSHALTRFLRKLKI